MTVMTLTTSRRLSGGCHLSAVCRHNGGAARGGTIDTCQWKSPPRVVAQMSPHKHKLVPELPDKSVKSWWKFLQMQSSMITITHCILENFAKIGIPVVFHTFWHFVTCLGWAFVTSGEQNGETNSATDGSAWKRWNGWWQERFYFATQCTTRILDMDDIGKVQFDSNYSDYFIKSVN